MPLYIKSPITGEQIQVAENDFPDRMNWDDAVRACQKLGSGWRLPDKDELKAMYEQLHKQGKGNFKNEWYWSSSQSNSGGAWVVSFGDGDVVSNIYDYKDGTNQVRAVRALP